MPRVTFAGRAHEVAGGTTVLDALLADGVELPHACRAGACGACVVRVRSGPVPPGCQVGLPPAWIARGCVYACQCRPEVDLAIEPLGEGLRVAGEVVSTAPLSGSVARVVVRVPEAFSPARGQYVTLERRGIARSFSVADRAGTALELHVRRIPGGALSPYLCDDARPGDPLSVAGPFGDCVYGEISPDVPLLLAATGTGLAPLWGIVLDALTAGHRAPIWLFHGAVDPSGLYLRAELRALAARHANLRYVPSALHAGAGGDGEVLEEGPLDAVVLRHVPATRGMRAFVCGAPDIVQVVKKKIFLAGAATRDISSDAFLPAAAPSEPTRASPGRAG
ncbi:MAG TPA: 2Fe-2S iron-sulfur cluster binding domain-containing protein [Kofleriaceae bacterium]|nr:2Fe-2S iron-sulfur cluster binding domain-containing protein [Kofleriaceae bacterium]